MTTGDGTLAGFGVEARFVREQAVLAVRGAVDISSAPKLGAYFDAVMACGCLSVVLDLAKLDVMDLAGFGVIAYGASRLVAAGGELTIRSPSARVTRIFDITWLSELVRLELSGAARDRLGHEQWVTVPATPVRSEPTNPFQGSRGSQPVPTASAVRRVALKDRARKGPDNG